MEEERKAYREENECGNLWWPAQEYKIILKNWQGIGLVVWEVDRGIFLQRQQPAQLLAAALLNSLKQSGEGQAAARDYCLEPWWIFVFWH